MGRMVRRNQNINNVDTKKPSRVASTRAAERSKTQFFLPHTEVQQSDPKYPAQAAPPLSKAVSGAIIQCPITSESAMKQIEENNTLSFVVDSRADKQKIKDAIKAS